MTGVYPFDIESLDHVFKNHFTHQGVKDLVFLTKDNNFDVSRWIRSLPEEFREIGQYICLKVENNLKCIPFNAVETPKFFVAMIQNEWFRIRPFIDEYLYMKYRLERRKELEQLPDWRRMLRTL